MTVTFGPTRWCDLSLRDLEELHRLCAQLRQRSWLEVAKGTSIQERSREALVEFVVCRWRQHVPVLTTIGCADHIVARYVIQTPTTDMYRFILMAIVPPGGGKSIRAMYNYLVTNYHTDCAGSGIVPSTAVAKLFRDSTAN